MNEIEAIKELNTYVSDEHKLKLSRECIDLARKALEKQISKKPTYLYGNYNCPVCKKPAMSVSARKKKWCDFCGQKLDWSGIE